MGQIDLVSGEIAEDLTYYFATSEQTPSAIGLGVLMNRDNTVRQAGGFLVQIMPDADDAVVSALEERLEMVSSVTDLLDAGHTPETMLAELLGDWDLIVTDKIPASFTCTCSRERATKTLISLGRENLTELIAVGKPIEVHCDMCGETYRFTADQLKACLEEKKER